MLIKMSIGLDEEIKRSICILNDVVVHNVIFNLLIKNCKYSEAKGLSIKKTFDNLLTENVKNLLLLRHYMYNCIIV